MTTKISIQTGDLTACKVDTIVNAANNDLILGGGLAGAIRTKGGPSIQEECTRHGPIEVGQAAITGAGDLPARYVIHQASMALGGRTTPAALRQSTAAVLALAERHRIATLAFPATGSGIGGIDMATCAKVMLGEVRRYLAEHDKTSLTEVRFVLFDDRAAETFRGVHQEMDRKHDPQGVP
ncbi:MAG: macro domain-containing protein [Phycisphaerae bacterium]|nr:macro domain-containing protein [Phycisphaerae bacterium]